MINELNIIDIILWILVIAFIFFTILIAVLQAREKSAFRASYETILLPIGTVGLLHLCGYSLGFDYESKLSVMALYAYFYWLFIWRQFTRKYLPSMSLTITIFLGLWMGIDIADIGEGLHGFHKTLLNSEIVFCVFFFEILYAPLLAGVSARVARRFRRVQ